MIYLSTKYVGRDILQDITWLLSIHVLGYKCLLFPAIHRTLLRPHKLDIGVIYYGSHHHVAIHVLRRYLTRESSF